MKIFDVVLFAVEFKFKTDFRLEFLHVERPPFDMVFVCDGAPNFAIGRVESPLNHQRFSQIIF